MPDLYLGEFEQVVLLAILRLQDGAYAIPVREEIEARTGRQVARGALYTALDRLEQKRCLRSRMSEPVAERGGRSRRYFTVTAPGLAALRGLPPRTAQSLERPRRATRIMRRSRRPPRLAERLLESIVGRNDRAEGLLGDLHEEFVRQAGDRPARAAAWYWMHSLRLSGRFTAQATLARVRPAGAARSVPLNRGDSTMRTIGIEARYALRALLKRPALTGIVVLTLALGLGANATIFAMIDALAASNNVRMITSVAGVLVMAALAAGYIPARRAAAIDPFAALRE
jgi:PadR family transcriptional regulator